MSEIKEYIGRKSLESVNYDGRGNNLYNMWITDEEIIRCKDCECFKSSFMRCNKHLSHLYAEDGKIVGYVELAVRPDDFCSWGERREA